MIDQYGYEPEKREDANTNRCYCQHVAAGVTRFWMGDRSRYVWHCADHLPRAAAILQAVTS